MTDWYVMQTQAGAEAKTREYVRKYVERDMYSEVFFPQRMIRRRYRGEWRDCLETLFPGYLFVVTKNPQGFAVQLRSMPQFARLLGNNDEFSSLAPHEIAMLQAFSLGPSADRMAADGKRGSKGAGAGGNFPHDAMTEYILGMSQGIKEGNKVIILNGPLMDKMAYVRKIDRHKRVAYVEFELCGRKVVTKMGLELIAKRAD